MTVIGDAYIDVKGKTDDFEGDVTGKIGSVAKKAAAIFVGAFAIDKVKDFIGDSIGAASDLAESTSKVSVVFGKQAADIEKWASSAAKNIGTSKQAALEAAGTYGNLFVALGITGEKAAGMSTKLVNLAGDLASFNNVSPTEALDALRSGLTGETEPLKRFGVNMNDATLHTEALKLGLIKNIKDGLDPSVKAQAAYSLILAQTKTAQGDFARTSDGLANKQRILAAQFEDVKAKVGQALLPVMLKLVTLLTSSLGPAFDSIARVVKQVSIGWNAWNDVMEDGGKSLGPIAQTIRTLHQGIDALFAAFREGDVTSDGFVGAMERLGVQLRKVWDALQPVFEFLQDHAKPILITLGIIILDLVAPWLTITAAIIYAYTHFKIFRDVVDLVVKGLAEFIGGVGREFGDLVDYLQRNWEDFSEAFGHIMVVIRDVVTPILLAIRAIWNAVSDDIFNYVERVWHMIYGIINAVMDQIRAVIQIVMALINGDWGKAWDGVKDLLRGIWDEMFAIVAGVLGIFESILGAFFSVFSTIWKNGWDGIINFLASVWDKIFGVFEAGFNWIIDHWKVLLAGLVVILTGGLAALVALIVTHIDDIVRFFKELPGRVLDAIGDVARWLYDKGKDLVGGLLAGVLDAAEMLWDFYIKLPGRVLSFLVDAAKWLYNTGKDILTGLVNGVVDVESALFDFWLKLPARILAFFINAQLWLFDMGKQLLQGFIDGMHSLWEATAGFFVSLVYSIPRWLGDLSRLIWDAGVALLRGFIDGMHSLWEATAGFFISLLWSIPRWMGEAGGLIVDLGRQLIDGFINGMHSLWGNVAGFFGSLIWSIPRWAGELPGLLVNMGYALISGFINGMLQLWGRVAEFIGGLAWSIIQWISDLPGRMWNMGRAVIDGFINGVQSLAGRLLDAIFGAFGPLEGVVRKIVGAHSPSRVFMRLGQDVMAGFALGVSDVSGVERALTAGIGGLRPSLAIGVSGYGAGLVRPPASAFAAAGAGVVVQLDLRGAMVTADSREMLSDIVTEGVVDAMEAVERKVQSS